MQIIIPTKKLDYLTKKYGNAQAIIQQVFDNWFAGEVNAEYDKKVKVDTDKKLDEINKVK
jgi:hypothetical protein